MDFAIVDSDLLVRDGCWVRGAEERAASSEFSYSRWFDSEALLVVWSCATDSISGVEGSECGVTAVEEEKAHRLGLGLVSVSQSALPDIGSTFLAWK